MGPKRGKSGKKAVAAKQAEAPTIVDGLSTEEMTKSQGTVTMMAETEDHYDRAERYPTKNATHVDQGALSETTSNDDETFLKHNGKKKAPVLGLGLVDLSEKIFIPTEKYPDYNFLGVIIGPKGSTMKMLATTTKTRLSVLGRHSMRDRAEEDKLFLSDEPEHQHLKEPLHVLIQVKAAANVAYARMSAAIKVITKYMTPPGETTGAIPIPVGPGGQPVLHYGIPPPGAIIIGQMPEQMDQQVSPMSQGDNSPGLKVSQWPQNKSSNKRTDSPDRHDTEPYRESDYRWEDTHAREESSKSPPRENRYRQPQSERFSDNKKVQDAMSYWRGSRR